jgi:2,4-dienoyl-CoA reductase [(3E)-enoyl-CoA-producing], peroxisomal
VLDEAVESLKQDGIKAMGFQGDVRQIGDCERWAADCVKSFGSLNILVNCAAGNFLATAEELSSGGFRSVMEIDALGTFNMSRAAHDALSKAKNACIINISATLHYGATWWQVHASAAKAAVDSITRTLALEWGSAGIRVNAVAPGPIQVRFLHACMATCPMHYAYVQACSCGWVLFTLRLLCGCCSGANRDCRSMAE